MAVWFNPSDASRVSVKVVLRDKTSTSPDCSAVNRTCEFRGTYFTFSLSPNTAAAKADAHDKVKTLDYLQKAASVNGLPQSVLDTINLAKAKVDSGDFAKAGDWIDKAIAALK